MEHLVQVVYQRRPVRLVHLKLAQLEAAYLDRDARAVLLDVMVDGRYRGRLCGVVSRTDMITWKQSHTDEPHIVAVVARTAAERLKTEIAHKPAALRAGRRFTFQCCHHSQPGFEPLGSPAPGALVLSFELPDGHGQQVIEQPDSDIHQHISRVLGTDHVIDLTRDYADVIRVLSPDRDLLTVPLDDPRIRALGVRYILSETQLLASDDTALTDWDSNAITIGLAEMVWPHPAEMVYHQTRLRLTNPSRLDELLNEMVRVPKRDGSSGGPAVG